MSKREIYRKYRAWRKEHNNQKPNRVYVKMYWEGDEIENWHYDTLGIENMYKLNFEDDERVLYYSKTLKHIWELTQKDNGSDFIILDIVSFDKV